MASYLVTGGAGFIGSHIVRKLLEDEAKVRVLDNFSTGKPENLHGLGKNLEVREADLRDLDEVKSAVKGVDIIFHEAAFVSVPESMEKPQECFDINVAATVALFEAARVAGVNRVVVASSAAVYGDSNALPLKENTPARSLSPYAASKRVDEIYTQLYKDVYDLEVVALRYFNVYGPRQRPDSPYAAAVPIFISRLLDNLPVTVFGNGKQTRDLINVRDVVRANLIASVHPNAPGQVLNICTGQETSLIDLLDVLLAMFQDAPDTEFTKPRPGDIYRSVGNPEFTTKTIDFRSEISLEAGLKETVAWMQA